MFEIKCPYGDDSLVVADYLAGRLSRAKAQAFEVHSFGCERCFLELQRAAEVRAASDKQLKPDKSAHRRRSRHWPSLAVAATVALALGLWMATPLVDDADVAVEPVYRDAGDDVDSGGQVALSLAVLRNGDSVSLRWTRVQGADQYRLHVFTKAGDPVFEQQTARTSIELSAAEWQDAAGPGKFYVQVIALDELRQIIVQSDFEPL